MVYNSTQTLKLVGHLWWVGNGFGEMKIDNVVTIVCHSNFITIGFVGGRRSHSKDRLALSLAGGKIPYLAHGVFVAKGGDFHGNWESRTKTITDLRFVN